MITVIEGASLLPKEVLVLMTEWGQASSKMPSLDQLVAGDAASLLTRDSARLTDLYSCYWHERTEVERQPTPETMS